MIKRFFKNIIRWLTPRLPKGVQGAIVDGLTAHSNDDITYRLLQDLATKFDIIGFSAQGDYGYILGSAGDSSVFKKYAREKTWAPSSNSLFSNFLRHGGTYLDIGGNIGLTTIPIAQNPAVRCHIFEPNPTTFRLLSANITANCRHDNVTMHNLALFDSDGTLTFETSPENFGDNRVRLSSKGGKMTEENWPTIDVAAKSLNSVSLEIDTLLAVKIDTQGAESFVISGGSQVLLNAHLVALEFWPYGMTRMGGDHCIVVEFLRNNFSYGQVSKGDSDSLGTWYPIDTIVGELESFAENSENPSAYLDVFVSKTLLKEA